MTRWSDGVVKSLVGAFPVPVRTGLASKSESIIILGNKQCLGNKLGNGLPSCITVLRRFGIAMAYLASAMVRYYCATPNKTESSRHEYPEISKIFRNATPNKTEYS